MLKTILSCKYCEVKPRGNKTVNQSETDLHIVCLSRLLEFRGCRVSMVLEYTS